MPAYMLTFVRVEDAETHARDYMPNAVPIVERHGGRPLSVTENFDVLEGSLPDGRLVLMEFPTKQHAEAFYADPEYQPLMEIRKKISSSDAVLFDSGWIG